MLSRIILLCSGTVMLMAQQTVAPSTVSEPSPTDKIGDYNVIQSFEVGYRAVGVSGDQSTYRSQVNYEDGIRLFAGDLEASSRDGKGGAFDQLSLRTQGLGNDPYESAMFRVEKNGWYEYDLNWRLQDYFNPGLTTTNGVHLENLQHRLQDHDLTLLPHSKVKLLFGYSRSAEDGPALSTFDEVGAGTTPLFENVRRTMDEYRVGVDATFAGFRLNILRSWEFFRDDTESPASAPLGGEFHRTQPNHGETPGWQLFLAKNFGQDLAFNGRLAYQGSGRGSTYDELAPLFPSSIPTRQVIVSGEASRPATAVNGNLTWSPTEKFSVTDQVSFDQVRMNGNDVYTQFDNGTLDATAVDFQLLAIRRTSEAIDASYQLNSVLGFNAGYQYTTRRFESIAAETNNQEPAPGRFVQNNELNAGRFGFRVRPIKPLSITFKGEIGKNSKPVYPVSEANYYSLDAHAQYRVGSLTLGATARRDYNLNDVSLSYFSSHSRSYGADASWAPQSWLSFDASWSKLALNAAGALFFFANQQPVAGTQSLYISNIQFGNLGVRLTAGRRAELYLGYSRVQDLGDGRSNIQGNGTNPVPAFNAAQTYPLLYDTPLARLTVPIAPRIRFNIGWQYYRYNEQFFSVRDYHANTAYTSLAWSF
ncbi:MAG TPA: hypothetical protein VFA04_04930 [Bryobacteraceae bacterium]|nr:hypothetical protein [Bryobacteraceae bacterium]